MVVAAEARILRSLTLAEHRRSQCLGLCDMTPGCVAVSFQDVPQRRADGTTELVRLCTLCGEGSMTTTNDHAAGPIERSDSVLQLVCRRDPTPRRAPWHQGIPTETFRQDQFRPGVPGAPAPFKKWQVPGAANRK